MKARRLEITSDSLKRARRFSLASAIQFRPLEEMTWQEGQVENVSRSGILFRAPQPLSVHTPIEMRFDLPAEMDGEMGAHVTCVGEIVRVVPAAGPQRPPQLGARIFDYRFVRSLGDRDH